MIFRIVFLILFIGSILVRLVYAPEGRTGAQRISTREGKFIQSSWIIVGFLIVTAGVSYLFNLNLFPWSSLGLPEPLRWAAAGAGSIGLGLLFWSHRTLGAQWSIALEIHEGHILTIAGPYAYVRHPMYSSAMLHYIALGILASDTILILIFIPIILLVYSRIDKEEEMLIEEFGEEYRAYMQATGRLLPRLGRKTQ